MAHSGLSFFFNFFFSDIIFLFFSLKKGQTRREEERGGGDTRLEPRLGTRRLDSGRGDSEWKGDGETRGRFLLILRWHRKLGQTEIPKAGYP